MRKKKNNTNNKTNKKVTQLIDIKAANMRFNMPQVQTQKHAHCK